MKASDLADVETELGVVLPEAYRGAMLAYPLDPTDANSRIALPDDARAVIAFNRFLREQFPDEWPPTYFAVGNGPCGDPYFLDLGTRSAAVWSWDHETHGVTRAAPDFGSWLVVLRSLEAGTGRA